MTDSKKDPSVPVGFYLGSLCKLGHKWHGRSQSIRYSKSRQCKECKSNWRQTSEAPSAGSAYFEGYRAQNRAAIQQSKQQRLLDPIKAAQYLEQKRAYKKTAKGKIADKRYKYMRRALEVKPYSAQELNDRFALFDCACAYCGVMGELTADHFVALSRGGVDAIENIVPACGRCNSSKNNSSAWEWYERQPFFDWYLWNVISENVGRV